MEHIDILLIEDNQADKSWVEIQLEKSFLSSYTIQCCEFIARAKDLIQTQNFSLIIIDLCLPGNRGLETINYFIQTSGLPVIIYTEISDSLVKQQAFRCGIFDYLVKGQTSPEVFINCINSCLAKKGSPESTTGG